jgi:uncharacterized protein
MTQPDNNLFKQNIIPVFSIHGDIELAYLFGSQVKSNTGPMSDVDIAVLFQQPVNDAVVIALQHQITVQLGLQVDLIPLNHGFIELAYAVISNGLMIYKKDTAAQVEYEAKILSLYCDYLPILRNQKQDILYGANHEKRVQRYREAFRRTERTLIALGTAKTKISQ